MDVINKMNGQDNNCKGEESKTREIFWVSHWWGWWEWYNVEMYGVIHTQIPVFLFIQGQFMELFDYKVLVHFVLLKCFGANELF